MPQGIVQHVDAGAELASRCQALGVTLLDVALNGRIVAVRAGSRDPLEGVVVRSPLFARALTEHLPAWSHEADPQPVAAWPGCWLMPIPVVRRRRRIAYQVAVLITADLAAAAPFPAWCDAAELDARAAEARLRRHAAAGPDDVGRLAALLRWAAADTQTVHACRADVEHLSAKLGETYEELNLVYHLSAHMSVTQDVATLLQDAVRELHQVVGFRWVAVYLTDDDRRLQEQLRGWTLLAGHCRASAAELALIGNDLLHSFATAGSTVIDDTAQLPIPSLHEVAHRLLIVPIIRDGKPLAILFGADKVGGSEFSSVDSKLVTSAAQSMGIFLENAMLYEDLHDMFMGTLRSLIATIDAKDTYTRGHSERVAFLSRSLAEAARLPPAQVRRVHLSALVHDVGKIGVPESVLCKPGRLTADEFAMMKAHPEIGVRILSDIHQMHDLLPGVLCHHERWDGRGYPHKLAADEIPLFGRIICLADSFDAMCTDRTYRTAVTEAQALEEIRACAGTQFDPDLAPVFRSLDFRPYHALAAEHQRRETPLTQAMRSVI